VSRARSPRHADDADVLPGVYERLSAATCRGQDPRCYLDPEGNVAVVQAALAVHSPLLDRFDANLPVVVPKWRITGNSNPGARQRYPWLSGAGSVRVFPDDRIEPTDDEADAG
jgi:hypothetical protein